MLRCKEGSTSRSIAACAQERGAHERRGIHEVPNSWVLAVKRKELTFNQFGVLVMLSHREWADHGEAHFTLRSFKDDTKYPRSVERLRQELEALAEGNWISAEVIGGGPAAEWAVRLAPAEDTVSHENRTNLQISAPRDLETDSKRVSKRVSKRPPESKSASAVSERDHGSHESPNASPNESQSPKVSTDSDPDSDPDVDRRKTFGLSTQCGDFPEPLLASRSEDGKDDGVPERSPCGQSGHVRMWRSRRTWHCATCEPWHFPGEVLDTAILDNSDADHGSSSGASAT